MKKYILLSFICLSQLVLTFTAFAKESQKPILLPTVYELRIMKSDRLKSYFKALRETMVDFEKDQNVVGTQYEAQMIRNNLLELLSAANAADEQSKGSPCVYAGDITEYLSNERHSCKRPPQGNCEPNKVQCNPILFFNKSGDPICVKAGDGATMRCQNSPELSDDLIGKKLEDENFKKKYDDFVTKFNSFCNNSNKPVKYNAPSCKRIKDRLALFNSKLPVSVPVTPVPVTVTVANVEDLPKPTSSQTSDCAPKSNLGEPCKVQCPVLVPDNETKYGRLQTLMTKACGVSNSDNVEKKKNAQEVSPEDMFYQFGACWNTLHKTEELPELLSNMDPSKFNELAGGSWLNSRSNAMLEYFGLNIKEARQIFCPYNWKDSGKPDDEAILDILRTPIQLDQIDPSRPGPMSIAIQNFNYKGNTDLELAKIKAITSGAGLKPTSEAELNKIKKTMEQRKLLYDCLSNKNKRLSCTSNKYQMTKNNSDMLLSYSLKTASLHAVCIQTTDNKNSTCVADHSGGTSQFKCNEPLEANNIKSIITYSCDSKSQFQGNYTNTYKPNTNIEQQPAPTAQ